MATETILHNLIQWPQRLFCTVSSNGHRDYSAQSHPMATETILDSLIQWPQRLFCTVSSNGHRDYSAQSHPMATETILDSLIQWPQSSATLHNISNAQRDYILHIRGATLFLFFLLLVLRTKDEEHNCVTSHRVYV